MPLTNLEHSFLSSITIVFNDFNERITNGLKKVCMLPALLLHIFLLFFLFFLMLKNKYLPTYLAQQYKLNILQIFCIHELALKNWAMSMHFDPIPIL